MHQQRRKTSHHISANSTSSNLRLSKRFSSNNVHFSQIGWLQTTVSCIQNLENCVQKRGACPSRAVGAAQRVHSLHVLPREHCPAPAHPESDFKYETNGLKTPSERCCSTGVPAAAFQPFLAASHCQNGDALSPHTVCVCFGVWVHASSAKALQSPPANQAASNLCYLQCSKVITRGTDVPL